MATLLIAEYDRQATDSNGARFPVDMPPVIEQPPLTFSASAQSAPIGASTRYVKLTPDADCRIKIGRNPTALVTGANNLFANQSSYHGVTPGDKIAVVAG